MRKQLVIVDSKALQNTNESPVVIAALLWVLALGSTVIASIILCGWRGAKQISFDWWHLKATFYCR